MFDISGIWNSWHRTNYNRKAYRLVPGGEESGASKWPADTKSENVNIFGNLNRNK